MSFKVGDKVKIRKGLMHGGLYGGIIFWREMYREGTQEIERIKDGYYILKNSSWCYTSEMLINCNDSEFITDVKVICPNKVVEVTFEDGIKEKAVCHDEDTFSLEQAISICICKKLIGGTKIYNKAIRDALKSYEKGLELKKKEEEKQQLIERKREKRRLKKERRAERKIEEAINIQKEAYIRAWKEFRYDND